jgi:hypothetical protein
VQPSGEQCGCSGGVYPQDAVGDSGLGAALAASRFGVRTGRPPLRSGLHEKEKEKVLKFVELTCLYPSLHGATWRMWGVGAECLWATWLSGEALGQHDRQQEYVQVGCETGVALLHATTAFHLRGNNSSLGHPVVHHIHNGVSLPAGYATMVRKFEKSGLA